nr:ADAMTS-like protein 1 isoform X2 [Paramormyrops kingsleyae]
MATGIHNAPWVFLLSFALLCKVGAEASDRKVFLREFTLIRRDPLPEETATEPLGGHKPDDPSSRTARSEEDRDTLWDAWGSWSECSRSCGGGASYSLRRCLSSRTCEGQNIKYRTCSNVDCPLGAGDFRAQQCSAHADVRHQGRYHEWLPLNNDPENPCALKCRARGSDLVVELAPKVLDGTRCYTESLDMCISGLCQIVGCDHELGSTAKEDNCGVCNGDGSTCRLIRGHYKSQQSAGKAEDTVVVVPYGSRHVRLVLKGPDHLFLESKTLQGVKGENSLSVPGHHHLENTTVDFQKFPDKEVLRMAGPLGADFTIKIRSVASVDSVVQFIFYQPIIHRWRETDFFPCSVTCGGGYQLTSAECYDLRGGRVVADQYCHYYPENVKPKPKLQECNMDPCPASDGYKQIMPYDLYHPLPRWESSPWTACSMSCGGGVQSRTVSCVEEDIQGTVTPAEEWKCLYSPKMAVVQPCNTFDCPTWLAQEWSACTVTCGQGLRYRVVLCVDHRGLHAGGCDAKTKPHIKDDCLVTVPCYKPAEKLPVEAKPPWFKQAQELDEETAVTEEPTFIPGPWSLCSRSCGVGTQQRSLKCQVLLSFSQAVADLPDDECDGPKPPSVRPCYRSPCWGPGAGVWGKEERQGESQEGAAARPDREDLHDWEYKGFTECSESCGGGLQEAVVVCRNKQTREPAEEALCVSARRPPQMVRACNTMPCPPRWEVGAWSPCSATCGVGLRTRAVVCARPRSHGDNGTVPAGESECRHPKPSSVQACNRFDCPPMWETQDWGPCSQSCGGGTQRQGAACKQRLADGSVLELPETFCPSRGPTALRPCNVTDCPPWWAPANWSQCSVTCGEGTQTMQTECRHDLNGEQRPVAPAACTSPAPPVAVRLCSPGPCAEPPEPGSVKLGPGIQAQRKVYIQWRKEKRLEFVTGGYAYLLPRTSVVLRCPAQRSRKDQVMWLKNGKPLASVPHLSITATGFLKIQRIAALDAGVYTCVAGQAHEDFVLKLLGSKQKLAVLDDSLWLAGSQEKLHPESPGARHSLGRYDAIVQRLLELKGPGWDGPISGDLRGSAERNMSSMEGEPVGEAHDPPTLEAETWKLDEILRNLSLWPGELGGTHGMEVLIQLLGELTRYHGDINESALHHPQEPKRAANSHISTSDVSTDSPRSGSFTHSPGAFPQAPIIIQKSQKIDDNRSPSEVVVFVGEPLQLSKSTSSVEIRCETLGHPKPELTWSKDGEELRYSTRIGRLPGGSLRILTPGRADQGLYTCTASNHAGTTSRSSLLQIAEATNQKPPAAGTCPGQECTPRWLTSPWSSCSASCGGGVQRRRVSCHRGGRADGVAASEEDPCARAGRRPPDSQPCDSQPCSWWATSAWGRCHGQCIGPRLAAQYRQVFCQAWNGTRLPASECRARSRPSLYRNCSTAACALQWRTGPWTQCTATCGNHGFQARRVACVYPRGPHRAPPGLHHCPPRGRPSSWRRCNIRPCSSRECRDSTRYCEKVRHLDLCSLVQFKTRCCESCRAT